VEYTDSDYPTGVASEYAASDSADASAFFVRAEGRSMTHASIDPGDLLLVEPAKTDPANIPNRAIVLAVTDAGQTVKRYYAAAGMIVLQPDGEEGEPLTISTAPDDQQQTPPRIYRVTEIRKRVG
jgi:SOS-response transcriptional repressor LexA